MVHACLSIFAGVVGGYVGRERRVEKNGEVGWRELDLYVRSLAWKFIFKQAMGG